MIPTHSSRSESSNIWGEPAILLIASPTNTTTTHIKITANVRATRSRKLNVRAYNSSEKAVMAIPAVSS